MIIDARTYTIAAGKMNYFLDTYESNGLPLQYKHGFDLAGYFTVETGPLNQVVHYSPRYKNTLLFQLQFPCPNIY